MKLLTHCSFCRNALVTRCYDIFLLCPLMYFIFTV
jgi:hypothetical protein